MRSEFQNYDFPKQRIPNSEKTPAWAAQCADFIIAVGQGIKDITDINTKYEILQGRYPDEAYRKVLNPYNAKDENYKRFPATMRNYDMIKGILRRYVSEYIKNPHDFIVGASNPEVVLARNAQLKQQLSVLVQQQIAVKMQQSYAQWLNDGQEPEDFKPQEAFDVEKFIKDFNEKYIDDISAQGQEILNVIKDITEDALLYARAYFDYVAFGEVYTYGDVVGKDLIKRNITVRDAYPIPTDNVFREDDDMFAANRKLTYQQISDEFQDYFTDRTQEFLDKYYGGIGQNVTAELAFSVYESYFPEVCDKYTKEDRNMFNKDNVMARDSNGNLYDVWHTVWRGEARQAIVTFVNAAGLIDSRIEADDYELNTEAGDMSIDYEYIPQVYECTRIGTKNDAIYPYDARPIAYNRRGKLPYNGLSELMPGFGKFSVIEIVTPHNIFYNIVAYHREMALARNKLSILMIAKSLLGKVPEETIYKMIADGVLYFDDTDDQGMLRAQQVRMLQSDNSNYIAQLGLLLQEIETTAKNQVDMTAQRYGDIANSAGKGTTQEAIVRGSMGSVVIEFMLDYMRERDYARDMDFSKFAWIDGLDTTYQDSEDKIRHVSLDVNKHNYADYLIKAKNSIREKEKLDQYKQLAFSAAQNGDMQMAVAAINGDNVASISNLIKKYQADKDAHEANLKQLEQQTQQMVEEWETRKIQVKGEEDRKLEELKGYIEAEIQLIKADANMISFDNGVAEVDKQAGMARLDQARRGVEKDKINLEKQKTVIDAYNKHQDREVKREDIKGKIQIAKQNKNRFDSKSKK